jgi:hypothetical protein
MHAYNRHQTLTCAFFSSHAGKTRARGGRKWQVPIVKIIYPRPRFRCRSFFFSMAFGLCYFGSLRWRSSYGRVWNFRIREVCVSCVRGRLLKCVFLWCVSVCASKRACKTEWVCALRTHTHTHLCIRTQAHMLRVSGWTRLNISMNDERTYVHIHTKHTHTHTCSA